MWHLHLKKQFSTTWTLLKSILLLSVYIRAGFFNFLATFLMKMPQNFEPLFTNMTKKMIVHGKLNVLKVKLITSSSIIKVTENFGLTKTSLYSKQFKWKWFYYNFKIIQAKIIYRTCSKIHKIKHNVKYRNFT